MIIIKNGFTLIELISVILILGIIAIITIPTVVEVINDSKAMANEQQIESIKNAGSLYSVEMDLGYEDNVTKSISFDTLISAGFLKPEDILNENKERLSGCVMYKWVNNSKQYDFWYDSDCN